MKIGKTRILCEAGILIALAQILSYIKLYEFPNGGSVDMAMLPLVVFAVRHGLGWGTGAGLVFGVLQYFLGNGFAIDWTTIIADYVVAFTLVGFGAGLFARRKYGVFWGSIVGCVLRFLCHLVVGAVVWGKLMPEEFLGLPMTNEWFYSFLYNISYMLPDLVILCALAALLYRPMKKYFTGADLLPAE